MPDDLAVRVQRLEQAMMRVDGLSSNQQRTLDSLISQTDQHDDSGSGFAIPGALGVVLTSAAITVPDGFTRAEVLAIGTVSGFNSTGGTDFMQIQVGINGTYSSGIFGSSAAPSTEGFAVNHQVRPLTGLLGGGTFTTSIKVVANGGNPWAAGGGNVARLSTFVTFQR
jgi:hypothetical protein